MLLALVDAVTHSVLGIAKRVYTIVMSYVYLHDMSLLNSTSIVGIPFACAGLVGYAYVKLTTAKAKEDTSWAAVMRHKTAISISSIVFGIVIFSWKWATMLYIDTDTAANLRSSPHMS